MAVITKKVFSFLMTIMFLLCMTGCGGSLEQPAADGTEGMQTSGGADSMQNPATESGIPSAAENDEQEERKGSYILEEVDLPNPELGLAELRGEGVKVIPFSFCLTTAGTLYREVNVMDSESNTRQGHYIQKLEPPYDSWTLTAVPCVYSEGDREYSVWQFYYSQGTLAFCEISDEDGIEYLAACDGSGNIEEILGAFPEAVQSDYANYTFMVGRAGNLYVFQKHGDKMFSLNRKMEAEQEAKTYNLLKMQGVITDAAEENVYWYGRDDSRTVVCDLSGNVVAEVENTVCGLDAVLEMGGDGRIYLASKTELWQLQGAERELLCNFGLCDYPFSEIYDIKEQGDGSILLYGKLDGGDCLVRAAEGTQTERQERQEIVFAFHDGGPGAMLRAVSRFNRQNDKYHITLIAPNENESWIECGERLRMEMVTGKGPDILSDYLLWDVSPYLENGYLAGLDGIIEDESQYLAAAFEGGRYNGILYGMPYDFMMHFAAYSEDFANGRTAWTLPELMEAVKASEAEILQYGCSGLDIVLQYGLYDNDNTAYIDWEKGESHLAEKPFLELLEFAYQYQDLKGSARAETENEMLQSGKAVAAYSYFYGENSLYALDTAFAGKAALLGYPRSEGAGIYAQSRYLYVNSASSCMEGIAEFFRFLLSENEQSRNLGDKPMTGLGITYIISYLPVNLNSFRQLTKYWQGGESGGITEKQVEQVNFLLENARPNNWHVQEIKSILSEELAPYFAGDKTAEQAAEILNNRVQIYLDERK